MNGIQSLYALSNKLNLNDVLPNKVTIWKLRNNNPLRKSYVNNDIKLGEFDALVKITVEMSKYLYPYIRELLQSKEDLKQNSVIWNDFNKRFIELIKERFNIVVNIRFSQWIIISYFPNSNFIWQNII